MKRLRELEVWDYRGFYGQHTVDLAGDFVLVHGGNASGKTSLLSAIEFAVSGQVSDLARFERDYPRCLEADGGIFGLDVRLGYEEQNGVTREVRRHLPRTDADKSAPESHAPSEREARFFAEHAHLSQSRLTGLLEAYGEKNAGEGADQVLVRLLRELLGLDVLERLRRGLHADEDLRRLRQRSEAIQEHERVLESLREEKERLDAQKLHYEENWTRALERLNAWLADKKSVETLPKWATDVSDVRTILHYAEQRVSAGTLSRELSQADGALRRARDRILELETTLRFDEYPSTDNLEARIKELDDNIKTQRGRVYQSTIAWAKLLSHYSSVELEVDTSAPERDVKRLRTHIDEVLKDLETSVSKLRAASRRAVEVRTELTEINKIEEQESVDQTAAQSIEKERSVLQQALSVVTDSNICPVCARDFNEVNDESLEAHVKRELERLGAHIDATQRKLREEAERQQTHRKLSDELTELTGRLGQDDVNLQKVQSWYERFQRIRAEADELLDIVGGVEKSRSERQELNREFEWRQELEKYSEYVQGLIADISSIVDVSDAQRASMAAKNRAETALTGIAKVRERESTNRRDLEEIGSWCERALESAEQTNETINRIEQWVRRKESEDKKAEKFARLREATKTLRQANRRAEKTIVDSVVNSSLNQLWSELFIRLAREETFRPQLETVKGRGDKLHASYRTIGREGQDFSHPGAILSSANANTAALSLFLSLNLIHEAPVEPIVLDDPVQNMDDVHIMELAALLRAINRQGNRQVIVSTHDESLWRYLWKELSPTRSGERLVSIQTSRIEGECHVATEVREWSEDRLKIV